MKAPILATSLLLLTLAAGCDWSLGWGDPCTQNHPAGADLIECQDDGTGDDTGDDGTEEHWCSPNQDLSVCIDLPQADLLAFFAGWVSRSLDSCGELSQPYDCTHEGSQYTCHMCEVLVWGAWTPTHQAPSNDGWHICWVEDFQQYMLAMNLHVDGYVHDWVPQLDCGHYTDAGACPLGFIENTPDGVTCRCNGSDDACQPGTVCEAGWVLGGLEGNSMIPIPTECTWDGAPITVGPPVYGLAQWGDGIEVDGDDIVLQPSMLRTLLPAAGEPVALLNDDQRVDARGVITHCGAGSLCEHVGLQVGERLVVPSFDLGALFAGEPLYIEVVRQRGRSRWLAIWLDI